MNEITKRVTPTQKEIDREKALVVRSGHLTLLWEKMSTLQSKDEWTDGLRHLYGEELADIPTSGIGILARDVLKQWGPWRPSVKELRDYAIAHSMRLPEHQLYKIGGGQLLLDDRSHIRDNVLPPLRARLDEVFKHAPEIVTARNKIKAERAKAPQWNSDVDHAATAEEVRQMPIDDAMRRIVRRELIDAGFDNPTPAMVDHRCRSKMHKTKDIRS